MNNQVVYIIAGVSGSGKSWICQSLSKYAEYVPYDKLTLDKALEIMKNANKPVLYDPTVNISTFIKKTKGMLNTKLLIVDGDFLTVKQQLIARGGKVTVGLYRRWKRIQSLKKQSIYSGSSSEVLKFLKNKLKPNLKIYKATTPSGRVYIGKTRNSIKSRIATHISDAKHRSTKYAFGHAINKYGAENITWDILETNITSFAYIDFLEKAYIKKYNSNDGKFGYNLTAGGDGGQLVAGSLTKKRESMEKYYQSNVGQERKKIQSEQSKELRKIRTDITINARLGRQSPESRIKTSIINIERYSSLIARQKHSQKLKEVYSDINVQRKATMANRKSRARVFIVKKIDGTSIGTWESPSTCAEDLQIQRNGIYACLKNRIKHSQGYIFQYIHLR